MSYVKICGLSQEAHVESAIDAGADAVGFVLVESPRQIGVERARALSRFAGERVDRVAVFRELTAAAIAMALDAECTHLQARGSYDAFATLALTPLPVVLDGVTATSELDALGPLGVPILFDGSHQGTGVLASIDRAEALARRARIVLAGGLHPANVAQIIAQVRPVGVDVSSGVELRRGEKDAALIVDFVRAARAAFSSLSLSLEVPPC